MNRFVSKAVLMLGILKRAVHEVRSWPIFRSFRPVAFAMNVVFPDPVMLYKIVSIHSNWDLAGV